MFISFADSYDCHEFILRKLARIDSTLQVNLEGLLFACKSF